MQKFKSRIQAIDAHITSQAKHLGHRAERYLIGSLFIWFGLIKIIGEPSATSIIAKSAYWFEPNVVVPALGVWEVVMGTCLLFRSTIRIAIALFFLRLPGTILAFIYHWDECFSESFLVPTIQGQYLLKELTLIGAALVVASTLPPIMDSKTHTDS